ncbi:DoxX family protein [Allonocardiopsis opalescens]|uniref:DoxX-like protein n=1 Tax=Allonocardiopsis opalescens TaxID=1144618 RepID=A0A2T0QEK9_9ACTN|nr:DoxX family protein [Allonocardiopsis opalescens]PRY02367.1 hypothetical protein CLV72_101969 [Allonocardiopsis opalescens]
MSAPTLSASRTAPASRRAADRVAAAARRAAALLSERSVDVLRVSLGLVFLAFGLLKFVPGLSPAEDLVVRTVDVLSLGLVPGPVGLVLVAVLETFIGVTLVTGRLLGPGLLALGGATVGFLAPLALFPVEMFGSGPSLAAQYIVKDIVLVAAALVVAAKAYGSRTRAAAGG